MPIDPRIALGYQPPQMESPVNMMLTAQKMQAGQQENALRQAQMENYQNQIARRNALLPHEIAKAEREASTANVKLEADAVKLANDRYGAYRRAVGALAIRPNVTKQDAVNAAAGLVTRGVLDQATVDAMVGQLPDDPVALQQAIRQNAVMDLTPEQVLTVFAPKATQVNAANRTEIIDTNPNSPTYGKLIKTVVHGLSPEAAARENRERTQGTGAPVAVVSADGQHIEYVRPKDAVGRTPANAIENIAPKDIQKREVAFPAATSAVKGFETKSDAFIRDLKALRDDPGLEQITGMIYGRTPSVSREGSRAQALYDKVTAKGGFQALQDLRDASKTGGALGNISNQEGKQLTASFAAIDRRQSAEDVRAAIDQAIADIEGSKTRMREAYDSTYEYRANRGAAGAGTAPAKGQRKTASGVTYTVED